MNELERKFYEYLTHNKHYRKPMIIKMLQQAHDLAEIAEKENTELKKQLAITKERIIEVLEGILEPYIFSKMTVNSIGEVIEPTEPIEMDEYCKLFNQIASEILGDDKNDKSK